MVSYLDRITLIILVVHLHDSQVVRLIIKDSLWSLRVLRIGQNIYFKKEREGVKYIKNYVSGFPTVQ